MSEAAPEVPAEQQPPVEAPAEPAPEAPPVEAPAPEQPVEAAPVETPAEPVAAPEGPDEAARAALVLAHDQLLGENAPDQVDDPLRDFTDVVPKFVGDALAFVEGTCLQHLPKSWHQEFKAQLVAALQQ